MNDVYKFILFKYQLIIKNKLKITTLATILETQ